MNAVFMQLEDGTILNLVHVVEAYLSNGIYCVRTTSGIFPISKSDFQRIQNLVI